MTLADISQVVPLYMALLEEEQAQAPARYPRITPQTDQEVEQALVISVTKNPHFRGEVYELGARDKPKIKAFATCALAQRLASEPKVYCTLDTIYLDPMLRRGLNRVGLALIQACWTWGFQALAPYVPDPAYRTLEGATMPGTDAEKLWTAAGLVPFRIQLAWVGPDGMPHQDMPRLLQVAPSAPSASCTPVQLEASGDGQSVRGG